MTRASAGHGTRKGARAPGRPRRARRSQEERSAETRSKVLHAATLCVAEEGFRAATMSAIATRAGVSWGAMQHHFGDKDSIFDQVLTAALTEFGSKLEGLAEAFPDPRARVAAFVRCCLTLLKGPSYRAFVEIQLGRRREEDEAWSRYVGEELDRIWLGLFGDLGVSRHRLRAARRFCFVVLSGIASESMLFPGVDFARAHLEILEETLLRRLAIEDAKA